MSHRAFTLIELLVVIAIMIILMGLIMGGVMLAKRMALRARAVALVESVSIAVDQYRSLNNVYPEYWKIPATPPATWTAVQAKSDWLNGLATPQEVYGEAFSGGRPSDEKVWLGVNMHLAWQLGSLISEKTDAEGKLLDVYKTPVRFRPSKWYPLTPNAPARIDSDKPPGLDSYQVWSAGPDMKDDAVNPGEGGDDIPHWAKQ